MPMMFSIRTNVLTDDAAGQDLASDWRQCGKWMVDLDGDGETEIAGWDRVGPEMCAFNSPLRCRSNGSAETADEMDCVTVSTTCTLSCKWRYR